MSGGAPFSAILGVPDGVVCTVIQIGRRSPAGWNGAVLSWNGYSVTLSGARAGVKMLGASPPPSPPTFVRHNPAERISTCSEGGQRGQRHPVGGECQQCWRWPPAPSASFAMVGRSSFLAKSPFTASPNFLRCSRSNSSKCPRQMPALARAIARILGIVSEPSCRIRQPNAIGDVCEHTSTSCAGETRLCRVPKHDLHTAVGSATGWRGMGAGTGAHLTQLAMTQLKEPRKRGFSVRWYSSHGFSSCR